MRKVVSGESLRIPAHDYNAFVDGASRRRYSGHDVGMRRLNRSSAEVVLVRNDTTDERGLGLEVSPYRAMAITGVVGEGEELTGSVTHHHVLTGSGLISTPFDPTRRVVITQQRIAPGALGWCAYAGLTMAWVSFLDTEQVPVESYRGVYFGENGPGNIGRLHAMPFGGIARVLWHGNPAEGPSHRHFLIDLAAVESSVPAILGEAVTVEDGPPGGRIYAYDWQEAVLEGTRYIARAGAPLYTLNQRALNQYELQWDAPPDLPAANPVYAATGPVCGILGQTPACPPTVVANVEMSPIPAGTCVHMRVQFDADGSARAVFAAMPRLTFGLGGEDVSLRTKVGAADARAWLPGWVRLTPEGE